MKKIILIVSILTSINAYANDPCHFIDDKTKETVYGRKGNTSNNSSTSLSGSAKGSVIVAEASGSVTRSSGTNDSQSKCIEDNPKDPYSPRTSTFYGDGWQGKTYEDRVKDEGNNKSSNKTWKNVRNFFGF